SYAVKSYGPGSTSSGIVTSVANAPSSSASTSPSAGLMLNSTVPLAVKPEPDTSTVSPGYASLTPNSRLRSSSWSSSPGSSGSSSPGSSGSSSPGSSGSSPPASSTTSKLPTSGSPSDPSTVISLS